MEANNYRKSKMVQRAKEVAIEQHKKQVRKFEGVPYVEHPKRVAELIAKYKSSKKLKELVSAGLLHDTIEDTKTKLKDLKAQFGDLVSSLVQELTSDKKEMRKFGKTEYLKKKMLGMSSWALVIKLVDRLDNVNSLDKATPEFRAKYAKETTEILDALEAGRVLSMTQKRIIKDIRDRLQALNEIK